MLRDVFLITIDCLRPDALGAYNLLRRQTPNLDQLADGGAVFTQAVSHAPYTTPAVASLLTGRYPFRTGVRLLVGQPCDPAVATLAEFARRAGYLTGGFPSLFLLNTDAGLDRGFDFYHQVSDGQETWRGGCWHDGNRINEAVDRFFAGAGQQSVFCWIHYFDLHDCHLDKSVPVETSYPRDLSERIDRGCIGGLIEILRRHRRLDDAGFVITADHGEDLFQHGHRGHGQHLYDSVLRVPLIWNFREPVRAGRIRAQVRHVDILPTLLDLWGHPRESWPAGLDGRSLVPLLRGGRVTEDDQPTPDNCSYAEASPRQQYDGDLTSFQNFQGPEQQALRTPFHKFIRHDDGRRELYDLLLDPMEMNNVVEVHRDLADRFACTMNEITAHDDRRFRQPDCRAPDEEKVMSRLRELGYVA